MITLSYKQVSEQPFISALQKLNGAAVTIGLAMHLKAITSAIHKARVAMSTEYQNEIIEKYGKKDGNGKVIPHEGGIFDIEESLKEDFARAQEAFGQKTFDIPRERLKATQFPQTFAISTADLHNLEPILDSGPEAA